MTTDRPRTRGNNPQSLNIISRSLPGNYSFVFTGEVRGLVDDNGNPINKIDNSKWRNKKACAVGKIKLSR